MESSESLESLDFFHALDPSDRELLAAISTRRSYAAETTIFTEGGHPEALLVLESGLVSLRQKQKGGPGDMQMMSITERGAVFGLAALVGEGHIYPHSAICLEDTEVVQIDGERLLALLHEKPEAGIRILLRFSQYLVARLSAAREQIRSRVRTGLISHG